MDKLTRRQIRYICFRLQIEAEGGNKAQPDKLHLRFVDEVKEHMESQEDFDGWKNFGKTWDVGDKAPLVVVTRMKSIQSEWNKILKEEAKEFPKEKKFLTNKLSEKVQEVKKKQPAAPEEIPPQEEVQENRKQSNPPAGRAGKTSFWDRLK